ncbi:MAG TPA: class I SAM-dependent methyltransferase [Solirubrobacteraceae bacterium]|nr:class I SAM-dependent methyltransferase [Solirubrobacteraceae bacterium]
MPSGQVKLAPSTADLPLREKVAGSIALFRDHWQAAREPSGFDWVFEDIDQYDRLLRTHGARPLPEARVFEIGYGARPYRFIAMSSMGIDVEGVDAEMPVLTGRPREFNAIFARNGLERVLKSLARHLLFDGHERRQFEEALRVRGLRPTLDPSRLLVADAASLDGIGPYDLIVSEDVFEHISEDSLGALVPALARWLAPTGLALIRPNIYTGITGGHLVEWNRRSFSRRSRRRSEPWGHLRGRGYQANTYLNRLTRDDYRKLFEAHFEILDEQVALPDLGRELLTESVRQELRSWDEEELFSNQVRFVLRPKT